MRRLLPLVLVLPLVVGPVCREPNVESNLEIVFIDVGAGSAVLLRAPDRQTCLIDGGPSFAGANKVCPLLDSLGVTELSYVIATNYAEERIGGLDEVIRYLGGERGVVEKCYDRGRSASTPHFAEYREAAGKRRETIRVGQKIELGEVTLTCLSRNGQVPGSGHRQARAEQDRSVALRVTYRDFSLLIPSDLSASSDGTRVDILSDLSEVCDEVEVLAVGDFGSGSAVSSRVMQQLNPVVSVLSVGAEQESLPEPRTVSRLLRRKRRLYQTNRTAATDVTDPGVRVVRGNIWITVGPDYYVVAGDTLRTFR